MCKDHDLLTAADAPSEILLDPIQFYKSLAEPIRLKSLLLISHYGELCVCELMVALNEHSQPKVSRNLALLRKNNLLVDRKCGQWVFYRLNTSLPKWVTTVLRQTHAGNAHYIQANMQGLDNMHNRPKKKTLC